MDERQIPLSLEYQVTTVLASNHAPKTEAPPLSPLNPSIETATFDQLRQMAEKGNPAAQNSLGLRYATGDGVKLNESEALRWFTKAAELGNVPAQSKLGSIYFSGRGVPQDSNRAYFWMVVARLSGDDASKALSSASECAHLAPRSHYRTRCRPLAPAASPLRKTRSGTTQSS